MSASLASNGKKVGSSGLTLRIGSECDFAAASCAPNVKAVDGDVEVPLLQALLASIELATPVDVFTAVRAFHRERCHQPDCDHLRTLLAQVLGRAPDRRGIEIRGVVFAQNLSLRHCDGGMGMLGLKKEKKWR